MLSSPPPGLCCRVVNGAHGLHLGNFPQISQNERIKLTTVGYKSLNLKKQNCSQHLILQNKAERMEFFPFVKYIVF